MRQLPRRALDNGFRRSRRMIGEKKVLTTQQASTGRARGDTFAATAIVWIEDSALSAHELIEPLPCAREALAKNGWLDLEHRRGLFAGKIEYVPEQVRDARLAIEAQDHRLGAAQSHLESEDGGLRILRHGGLVAEARQSLLQGL